MVAELEIGGCLGCDCCQSPLEDLDCAQSDDAGEVLRQILAADLTVYAAPVYCWSVPAQMKALIDRHYCMVKWEGGEVTVALMRGKRAALLLTCGGEAATNVDLTFPMFERQMEYMRAEVAGMYALDNCVGPREDAPRAEALALRMAQELL
jgi:multimeric flavodoxin WrbA